MACYVTCASTSYEEPPRARRADFDGQGSIRQRHRRRHTSYHTQPWYFEHDNTRQLLDRFLVELATRLDFLESYGQLKIDHGIERAYSTLHAVRERCSLVSDEVIGAGRRRAKILVETLEESYNCTLARKQTMEHKVQEGVRLMEAILADFEARAYALRDSGLAVAAVGGLVPSGMRRRVDSGFERAKEVVDEGLLKAKRAKEALKIKIDAAVQTAREHGLIRYEDLPEPWRGNPHIRRGYRFCETKIECFRSILGVSNELVNIWSHLVGFIVVLALAFYIYPSSSNFSISTTSDVLVAGFFFLAACECLFCSTLWHTMCSISSQPTMERFACIDYTGISLLVATSIMTSEWCAFYCEPVSRWAYMSTTAILGLCGTILPWHPSFNRADLAWLRVSFFVALAATGFLPVFQLAMTRGVDWAVYFYAPLMKSLFVYLVGAFLYAVQVPERFFPGAFDYVGGSHNLWHFAVLGGILFHYGAMQEFFRQAFLRAGSLGQYCSSY